MFSTPNYTKTGYAAILLCTLFALSCQEDYSDGKEIYDRQCASCHGTAGQGLGDLIPPVAGSNWITDPTLRARIPCAIRQGMQGPIEVNGKTYEGVMQAYPNMSDIDINNVLNYIAGAWGNKAAPFQIQETRTLLKACE
jgi:mono/diheme cytochrome c family protein